MVRAGASVVGTVVSETDAGPLEHHIVEWDDAMIDWLRAPPERGSESSPSAGRVLPLAIRRHARATRLTMRLAPDGSEVRITLPRWGRTADALVFAQKPHRLARRPACRGAARHASAAGRLGASIAARRCRSAWRAGLPRKPALADGSRRHRRACRDRRPARSGAGWKARRCASCRSDLADYCARAGVPEPALRLSRARRRWGSCSGKGCIRINWRLVQAPDEVRRSVVAHEVAHLVHFDHSPAFHALLAALFEGDLKDADAGWESTGAGYMLHLADLTAN